MPPKRKTKLDKSIESLEPIYDNDHLMNKIRSLAEKYNIQYEVTTARSKYFTIVNVFNEIKKSKKDVAKRQDFIGFVDALDESGLILNGSGTYYHVSVVDEEETPSDHQHGGQMVLYQQQAGQLVPVAMHNGQLVPINTNNQLVPVNRNNRQVGHRNVREPISESSDEELTFRNDRIRRYINESVENRDGRPWINWQRIASLGGTTPMLYGVSGAACISFCVYCICEAVKSVSRDVTTSASATLMTTVAGLAASIIGASALLGQHLVRNNNNINNTNQLHEEIQRRIAPPPNAPTPVNVTINNNNRDVNTDEGQLVEQTLRNQPEMSDATTQLTRQ
jgi:hypothetical protein